LLLQLLQFLPGFGIGTAACGLQLHSGGRDRECRWMPPLPPVESGGVRARLKVFMGCRCDTRWAHLRQNCPQVVDHVSGQRSRCFWVLGDVTGCWRLRLQLEKSQKKRRGAECKYSCNFRLKQFQSASRSASHSRVPYLISQLHSTRLATANLD
jgi:hypothetical protein